MTTTRQQVEAVIHRVAGNRVSEAKIRAKIGREVARLETPRQQTRKAPEAPTIEQLVGERLARGEPRTVAQKEVWGASEEVKFTTTLGGSAPL